MQFYSGNSWRPLLLMALLSAPALADTPAAFDPVAAVAHAIPRTRPHLPSSLPSHGVELYGVYSRAAGAAAHPTVLMLHGFQ